MDLCLECDTKRCIELLDILEKVLQLFKLFNYWKWYYNYKLEIKLFNYWKRYYINRLVLDDR